jgi:hypothetical protein
MRGATGAMIDTMTDATTHAMTAITIVVTAGAIGTGITITVTPGAITESTTPIDSNINRNSDGVFSATGPAFFEPGPVCEFLTYPTPRIGQLVLYFASTSVPSVPPR